MEEGHCRSERGLDLGGILGDGRLLDLFHRGSDGRNDGLIALSPLQALSMPLDRRLVPPFDEFLFFRLTGRCRFFFFGHRG